MLVYIFPADNFTISFRTSDKRRAAGFRGYAVCYEPELTDSEGAHSLINTGTKVVTVTKKHTHIHTHTHTIQDAQRHQVMKLTTPRVGDDESVILKIL